MAIKLTKKPARTDLTNRECSKIICGLVLPMVRLYDAQTVFTVINYLASSNPLWKLFKRKGKSELLLKKAEAQRLEALKLQRHRDCEMSIGALVGALTEMADLDAVREAVIWTRDHFDDFGFDHARFKIDPS